MNALITICLRKSRVLISYKLPSPTTFPPITPKTMKICISFFLPFFSFLVSSDAAEAVRDIDGSMILPRVGYYILPVIRGAGGGLTLASLGNKSCPLNVAQDRFEVSRGVPLTFMPVDPRTRVVSLATDQNVKFLTSPTCGQSTAWKLDAFDESTKQYFVAVGGVEGNPGRGTTGNWFKIERYEQDYKLVFCPTVCDVCRVICRDIGIYVKDGKRFLALSENPFRVMFKRA